MLFFKIGQCHCRHCNACVSKNENNNNDDRNAATQSRASKRMQQYTQAGWKHVSSPVRQAPGATRKDPLNMKRRRNRRKVTKADRGHTKTVCM